MQDLDRIQRKKADPVYKTKQIERDSETYDSDSEFSQVSRKRVRLPCKPVTRPIAPTSNRFEVLGKVPSRLNALLTPVEKHMEIKQNKLKLRAAYSSNISSQAGTSYLDDRDYPRLSEHRQTRRCIKPPNSQPTPGQRPRHTVYKEVKYTTTSYGLVIIDKENCIRQSTEEEPIQVDEPPQAKRPPPLYHTDTERYTELRNNLQPKYTKQHRKGICLYTIEDFRKLRKIMDIHSKEQFTFKLEEEKPLKVVTR